MAVNISQDELHNSLAMILTLNIKAVSCTILPQITEIMKKLAPVPKKSTNQNYFIFIVTTLCLRFPRALNHFMNMFITKVMTKNVFLKAKFEDKTNPYYYIEELDNDELMKKREDHKFLTFSTIEGSSTFCAILFEPISNVFKAAPRLCVCPLCQDNLGSCNLFTTYEPVVQYLKKPYLRSAGVDISATDDNENKNIDDFFLLG